jgi:hypothetical protein
VLNRLVGRAVFADEDRVVGQNVDEGHLHQRGQAYRRPEVIAEHQERGDKRPQAAVQRHAVSDRRHRQLAHAEVHRPPAGVVRAIIAVLGQGGVIGGGKVRGATDHVGQHLRDRLQGVAARLSGCHLVSDGVLGQGDILEQCGIPATNRFIPLRQKSRVCGTPRIKRLFPRGVRFGELGLTRGKELRRLRGDVEHLLRINADLFLGQGDLVVTQRRAMNAVSTRLVGGAFSDSRAEDHHARLSRLRVRFGDQLPDRVCIVRVAFQHLPAVGAIARRDILGKRQLGGTLDGDAVGVVKDGQFSQFEVTRQGARLGGDSLHHAAVPGDRVGMVVDDRLVGGVKACSGHLLRDRNPHRVGDALAQRTGGRLKPDGLAVLRVTRRLAADLAEFLDLFQGQSVAGKMQQAVQEHRTVTRGKNKPVPVGPVRIAGVVLHDFAVQQSTKLGHTHRHTGVSGICRLYCVNCQGTY